MITRHPWRCHAFGCRVHHGAVGVVTVGTGVVLGIDTLVFVGALLVAHDADDFPWWPLREPPAPHPLRDEEVGWTTDTAPPW